MKILFLGSKKDRYNKLLKYLKHREDVVISTEEPINLNFLKKHNPDFIVSYGYRHIIKKDILDEYKGRAINLHISYLPWNKGAEPCFWSLIENTPRGVTIHYLDEGLDTGDIIAQEIVEFSSEKDTLQTSYEKLHEAIKVLFTKNWDCIRIGTCKREKQVEMGTSHRLKEKKTIEHLLTNGKDTPIHVLEKYNIGD